MGLKYDTSSEEICKELLKSAVDDGLVIMVDGENPLHLSNGDVIAMANKLNSFFPDLVTSKEEKEEEEKDEIIEAIGRHTYHIPQRTTCAKHTIDLGAPPKLPFDRAEVVKHITEIGGKSVVEIELRSDDNLYIDRRKIILSLSERQIGEKRIVGHELRQELEDGEQVLLNSNVEDYIFEHPELFPEHWKKDENGEIRYIYFWGSIFRNPSSGHLFVRYLFWGSGSLHRDYAWLDNGWLRQDPSASLAS